MGMTIAEGGVRIGKAGLAPANLREPWATSNPAVKSLFLIPGHDCVKDWTHFYIDLLFYHLRLRCFVVVDLKVGRFTPEYAVRGLDKAMGVSAYELTRALPKTLQSALPGIEQLEREFLPGTAPKPVVPIKSKAGKPPRNPRETRPARPEARRNHPCRRGRRNRPRC
jgi:hypothetical protein